MRDPSKTNHVPLAKPDLTSSGFATITEAADHLRCSTKTVRRYIATGRLAAFRVGPRMLRIETSDLDALIRAIPTRRPA